MEYFNARRLYQATFGLRDGLSPTEHRVLEVLARKMANRTKPGTLTVKDTCFPSLETIAKESLFAERTVRYALDVVIERGVITKSHIEGRKLYPGKRRNKYENCRYHLVPEVWDVIPTPFDKATVDEGDRGVVPNMSEEESAADQEFVEALDTKQPSPLPSMPVPKESAPTRASQSIEQIEVLLRTRFGSHPTYADERAMQIMRDCVGTCVTLAGSADRCLDVMWQAFGNDAIRENVAKSRMLGGYVKQSFEGWLKTYPAVQQREFDDDALGELLQQAGAVDSQEVCFPKHILPSTVNACVARLTELAGDKFQISDVEYEPEGQYLSLCRSLPPDHPRATDATDTSAIENSGGAADPVRATQAQPDGIEAILALDHVGARLTPANAQWVIRGLEGEYGLDGGGVRWALSLVDDIALRRAAHPDKKSPAGYLRKCLYESIQKEIKATALEMFHYTKEHGEYVVTFGPEMSDKLVERNMSTFRDLAGGDITVGELDVRKVDGGFERRSVLKVRTPSTLPASSVTESEYDSNDDPVQQMIDEQFAQEEENWVSEEPEEVDYWEDPEEREFRKWRS